MACGLAMRACVQKQTMRIAILRGRRRAERAKWHEIKLPRCTHRNPCSRLQDRQLEPQRVVLGSMQHTRNSSLLLLLLAAALGLAAAQQTLDGELVLRNAKGMEVGILPTGACVRRLLVPLDNPGACSPPVVDVMLGFDDEEQYRVRLGCGVWWLGKERDAGGRPGARACWSRRLPCAAAHGTPLGTRPPAPQNHRMAPA